MATPFIGQLMAVSFSFAPKGWAATNGQLLAINQNAALFSLLGTTYGGNGQTTFAIPDLRGQVPVCFGAGFNLGQKGGEAAHTLTISEIPQHLHQVQATSAAGTLPIPAGNVPAGSPMYLASPPDPGASAMASLAFGFAGSSQPHQNMQPFLVINWLIALIGIFPSRN